MANSPRNLKRFYEMRNNMEEKDLKLTLAKLDGEKLESLHRLQRRKDRFSEGHSKHMFSLQFDRLQSRKRWTKKADEIGLKDKPKLASPLTTNQLTDIQMMPQLRSHRPEGKIVTEMHLKLPAVPNTETKQFLIQKSQTTLDTKNISDEPDSESDIEVKKEKLVPRRRKILRMDSKGIVQNVDIPVTKLELFRQFSHRVRRLSTWCYLLRDVFDRLSRDREYVGYNMHLENKSMTQMFDELKTCRYLRLPPEHACEQTRAVSDYTQSYRSNDKS